MQRKYFAKPSFLYTIFLPKNIAQYLQYGRATSGFSSKLYVCREDTHCFGINVRAVGEFLNLDSHFS